MTEIIFTAIVGGLPPASLPLGGGATVLNGLVREWAAQRDLSLTVLGTGAEAHAASLFPANVTYVPMRLQWPDGSSPNALTNLNAFQYARIARQFERAATQWLLERARKHAPRKACVVCNDVSEGVDFRCVAAAGCPIITIFNVDVVDFFAKFYLSSAAKPHSLTRWHRGLERVGLARCLPRVLQLVFQKQAECVRHSRRIIVPSHPMKEILLRCYPWKSAEEIIVVPWGALEGVGAIFNRDGLQSRMQFAPTKADAASVSENIRFEFSVTDNDFVLLTLSRLSREKGLEALLRALLLWEASDDPTVGRVRLFIGGEAAYMGGERYKQELQRLSKRLRRAKAFFVGHVDGARKQAFFDVADLFVMPSRHESYGLTLVEAMRAGLPVLTSNHYSAAEIVGDGGGRVVSWDGERDAASALKDALVEMAADREALQQMGKAAAQRAQTMRFSAAAAKIKELVAEVVATDARG